MFWHGLLCPQLQKYLASLRVKSQEYKKKKAELATLRTECGVLEKTETLLKSRYQVVQESLTDLEKKEGVAGYRDTQEELEKVKSVCVCL